MSDAFNIGTAAEGANGAADGGAAGAASQAGGDGFAAVGVIMEEGFLGSGYAATVEVAFVAMGVILCWVTYETSRYILAVTGLGERIVEKLGLGGE